MHHRYLSSLLVMYYNLELLYTMGYYPLYSCNSMPICRVFFGDSAQEDLFNTTCKKNIVYSKFNHKYNVLRVKATASDAPIIYLGTYGYLSVFMNSDRF